MFSNKLTGNLYDLLTLEFKDKTDVNCPTSAFSGKVVLANNFICPWNQGQRELPL